MYWNINFFKAKNLDLTTQNGKYQFKNIQHESDLTIASEKLILILPDKTEITYFNVEVSMDQFNNIYITRAEKYQNKNKDVTTTVYGFSFDMNKQTQKEGKVVFTSKKLEKTFFGNVFNNGVLVSTNLIINKSLDGKTSLSNGNFGNINSIMNMKSLNKESIVVFEQLEDVSFFDNGSMKSINKRTQILKNGMVHVSENMIFDESGKEIVQTGTDSKILNNNNNKLS